MGEIRRHLSKIYARASSEPTSSTEATVSSDPARYGPAIQTKEPSSAIARQEIDSTPDTVGWPEQQNAAIENLPAEIRRLILDALDYESLRALTRASPTFHEQYRRSRRALLSGCLQRALGAATVDACAVHRSSSDSFSDTRTREYVAEFLQDYEARRSSATYSIVDEALSEDGAVAMAAFHFGVIEPLFQRFTSRALTHLANETGTSSPHHAPLSMTERSRIVRAMYRFQLCCNLFGERRGQLKRHFWDPIDVARLFFCLFEPWEVEEVVCIYTFVKDEFDRIFSDIYWDVNEKNARFADQRRPPTPDGAFDLDRERDFWLGGTVLRGFELLHTVLFKVRDHEHLVTTMQQGMGLGGQLFGHALSEATQSERRREHISERDVKHRAREPLPFVGDQEPETHGPCPPLAWTLIWKGTYSSLYGDYINEEMHRWGYVLWDAARLETERGKALLMRQWGGDWDPRDFAG